ncbi:MAG TPA: cysteine synthase A [Clostridia bacterium]|nr:cysteine synthase A [Clostridia bacterium]
MNEIYKSVTELIGNTPLLEIGGFMKIHNINATILAKLEHFNPAGSVKDRVAKSMIEDAENRGLLKEGSVIIEPTSGNTGIGLASIAAQRGYRIILTMPETMSIERRSLLKAFGAEIVLSDGGLGMKGAIEKAEELSDDIPNSFMPSQFENPANPAAHVATTAPEIWEDTQGKVDYFISCVGTGGTLSGVGEYLKKKNPEIKIIAVEPEGSAILSGGQAGKHSIQGIGAGFVPKTLNTEIYDEVITVSDKEAFEASREIAKSDGILVGISSGAAAAATLKIAKRAESKNKTIVVLFPDTGERYLSTELYSK